MSIDAGPSSQRLGAQEAAARAVSVRVPVAYDASPRRVPMWVRAAPWVLAFLVACAWDRAVWLMATRSGVPLLQWLEDSIAGSNFLATLKAAAKLDLRAVGQLVIALAYGAVYMFGRIWPWIGLALFFIFRHWGGTDGSKVRQGLRRGTFVFLVPAIAGLAAEALKLITRRARPEVYDGLYQFMPWPKSGGVLAPEFWSTSGLGLASSHAAVAVGGALAAGLLLPRWRTPLFAMAFFCTLSRLATASHFVSDTVAGVAIAYGAFCLVYAWDRRNNRGVGIEQEGHGQDARGTQVTGQ